MKRVLLTLTIMALVIATSGTGIAQGNPRGTAKLALKDGAVSVEYGRPSLKGRTFDQLLGRLGEGKVWRLGADTSTTFTTGVDLAVGGLTVPKGDYSLWALKGAGGWNLVFNKQHGQWGTEHDAKQDLGSTALKESKGAKSEEMVTINLTKDGDGGSITILWGDKVLSASFKAK